MEQWSKNKSMYRIPTCGLFLTCTKESIFIKNTQIQVIKILLTRVYIWNKTHTRNAGSLSMAATPHPCWSLAQSQLPHCSPLPSVPHAHYPQHNIYLHTDNINTPASSWSGTVNASYSYHSDQWMYALPCNMHMYKLIVYGKILDEPTYHSYSFICMLHGSAYIHIIILGLFYIEYLFTLSKYVCMDNSRIVPDHDRGRRK